MIYKQTTQIPNTLFDQYLPKLTESELKILLIILRQTNGWIDKRTGNRKTKDKISQAQFITKTGLSRRVVSTTIKSLVERGLIDVFDQKGYSLHRPKDRRGNSRMYYASTLQMPIRSNFTHGFSHIGEILNKNPPL